MSSKSIQLTQDFFIINSIGSIIELACHAISKSSFNRFPFVFGISMSIDQRCLQLAVPKPLGDSLKIHAVLVQMHCPCMPPHMWMGIVRNIRAVFFGRSSVSLNSVARGIVTHLYFLPFVPSEK